MSTIYWSEEKEKKHLRSSRRGVDGQILFSLFIKGLDWTGFVFVEIGIRGLLW